MFEFILDNVSFRGRARRLDYWLFALLGPIILGFVGVLVAMVLGRAGLIIALVLGLLYMVVSLGLHVRRLHDREMSGHWLWVFWGAPFLLQAVGSMSHVVAVQTFCSIVSVVITLWCLVELGIFRGTPGPNAYGDDPVRD